MKNQFIEREVEKHKINNRLLKFTEKNIFNRLLHGGKK
jgi:hypothetical protein